MSEHNIKEPDQKRRKKRHVFLWFFLAIQALFIIWVITGIASGTTHCHGQGAQLCRDASHTGTAIGVGLIFVSWAVVDFILGICYAIYRLAKRP
jgi:hypothetical protein